MSDKNDHQKNLLRIMTFSTALSLAVLGAVAVSMKSFGGGEGGFQFSWKTVVAFFVGGALGWFFWRIIQSKAERAAESEKK